MRVGEFRPRRGLWNFWSNPLLPHGQRHKVMQIAQCPVRVFLSHLQLEYCCVVLLWLWPISPNLSLRPFNVSGDNPRPNHSTKITKKQFQQECLRDLHQKKKPTGVCRSTSHSLAAVVSCIVCRGGRIQCAGGTSVGVAYPGSGISVEIINFLTYISTGSDQKVLSSSNNMQHKCIRDLFRAPKKNFKQIMLPTNGVRRAPFSCRVLGRFCYPVCFPFFFRRNNSNGCRNILLVQSN